MWGKWLTGYKQWIPGQQAMAVAPVLDAARQGHLQVRPNPPTHTVRALTCLIMPRRALALVPASSASRRPPCHTQTVDGVVRRDASGAGVVVCAQGGAHEAQRLMDFAAATIGGTALFVTASATLKESVRRAFRKMQMAAMKPEDFRRVEEASRCAPVALSPCALFRNSSSAAASARQRRARFCAAA